MGQPIRVSQSLSLVMVVVAAFMLFYNIKIKKRTADGLLVNQLAAAEEARLAAEAAEGAETAESVEEILTNTTVETPEKEEKNGGTD